MRLVSIAHALPELRISQSDAWAILKDSPSVATLKPRSVEILRKVLTNDSGIDTRHFAVTDFEKLFLRSADELSLCFEREAPKLADLALARALEKAGLAPKNIDALFVCTCTGYLCPGISSHLAEIRGLGSGTYLADLVGLGCGAAIPTLRAASGFAAQNPDANVAVVAVEVCSAAFYLNDDPGVLISLCLFGDGASASIWRGDESREPAWKIDGWDTIHAPQHRELLRFENREGKLCNKLSRDVPGVAAELVSTLFKRAPKLTGDLEIVSHGGGRDVLESLRATFPGQALEIPGKVLQRCGNMSSPSVLIALEERLGEPGVGPLWLTSFGAGFSAHSCLMEQV